MLQTLINLWNKAKGKRTYTVVVLSLIYVIIGIYLKQLTFQQAVQIAEVALGLGGLRAALPQV